MPDIWMDVDVALAEVPVNLMPLLDDTDFKTRETAVAYNAAGMDLVWNFVTCAGAMSQTAVTPTTGGSYDWAHQGDGMYSIEIPASGGASINNDTEGFGWFTGVATGVLPWRGPVIGFRAAQMNDDMVDSATLGVLKPATAGRTLNVDTNGRVLLQGGLRRNVALPKFTFLMTDSTNHNPATGLTVSGSVRKDGGSSASLTDTVTELANGEYEVDISATEMDAAVVRLRFTATGADDLVITLLTDA